MDKKFIVSVGEYSTSGTREEIIDYVTEALDTLEVAEEVALVIYRDTDE